MALLILLGVGLLGFILFHDDDPYWHGNVYRGDDDE